MSTPLAILRHLADHSLVTRYSIQYGARLGETTVQLDLQALVAAKAVGRRRTGYGRYLTYWYAITDVGRGVLAELEREEAAREPESVTPLERTTPRGIVPRAIARMPELHRVMVGWRAP